MKTGKHVTSLTEHKDTILTIKKINHFKYGECFFPLGLNEDSIKLYVVNRKWLD